MLFDEAVQTGRHKHSTIWMCFKVGHSFADLLCGSVMLSFALELQVRPQHAVHACTCAAIEGGMTGFEVSRVWQDSTPIRKRTRAGEQS